MSQVKSTDVLSDSRQARSSWCIDLKQGANFPVCIRVPLTRKGASWPASSSRLLLLHHVRVPASTCESAVHKRQRTGHSRDDAAHSQSNPQQTPISQRLARNHPSHSNDQASLEVPHNSAAHRSRLIDDHKLRKIDQTSQKSALSTKSASSSPKPKRKLELTTPISP